MGAWIMCSKGNYVSETLHRNATLYCALMLQHDLEWLRTNIFVVLSDGSNAISMDKLNKFFN